MGRIKELNQYQKGILLLLSAMIVVFGVIYARVSSNVGFLYNDVFFELSKENGTSIYSGTINDQECRFTVTTDKTVTFQCGEKTYGPYTAKEDPTAVPKEKDYLTGIEILDGNEVFFRGGFYRSGGELILFDEDGGIDLGVTVITNSNGISVDGNGNIIDKMEPSAHTVLELMSNPELVNKGEWIAYFCGILISFFIAVSILFADELFRFHLIFRVRNVYQVEPSDWEVMGRYIGWTVLTVTAFVIYMIGLR